MGGFPEPQGGGSLILAWQVKHKKVVIIGGGEVRIVPDAQPQSLLTLTQSHR